MPSKLTISRVTFGQEPPHTLQSGVAQILLAHLKQDSSWRFTQIDSFTAGTKRTDDQAPLDSPDLDDLDVRDTRGLNHQPLTDPRDS